jgi:TPR repeat protein
MKYLFLLLPILAICSGFNNFTFPTKKMEIVSTEELEKCYDSGRGDNKCGKDLALILKNEVGKEELAAEIFLDLSLKGDVEATRELALLYIYGKEIKQDCQKGIFILLNAADGRKNRKESNIAFKNISDLFKDGICVEKDLEKYKKYNDIYLKKVKEELNN